MNIATKIAVTGLAIIVLGCGYLALTGHKPRHDLRLCPNATQAVRPNIPIPIAPESIRYPVNQKQFAEAIKAINDKLPLVTVASHTVK
jgi:hypothetical protein